MGSSKWGWLFIAVGIFLFFAGARTLQGRIALTAFPIILFGIVLYGWGKDVARIVLFPIAFLLFMVPLNFLTQATMKLQFIETGAASAICNFLGIGVYAVGTTINAANNVSISRLTKVAAAFARSWRSRCSRRCMRISLKIVFGKNWPFSPPPLSLRSSVTPAGSSPSW